MRNKLKKSENIRKRFAAFFIRYGTKVGYTGRTEITLLLKEIVDLHTLEIVADHIWFTQTKGFASLGNLKEKVIVEFDARVKPYIKGYVNYRQGIDDRQIDYRLSHPTKIISKNISDYLN